MKSPDKLNKLYITSPQVLIYSERHPFLKLNDPLVAWRTWGHLMIWKIYIYSIISILILSNGFSAYWLCAIGEDLVVFYSECPHYRISKNIWRQTLLCCLKLRLKNCDTIHTNSIHLEKLKAKYLKSFVCFLFLLPWSCKNYLERFCEFVSVSIVLYCIEASIEFFK